MITMHLILRTGRFLIVVFIIFFFGGGDTFCNLAFKILYQVSFTCSGIQIITEMIFIINYKFTL